MQHRSDDEIPQRQNWEEQAAAGVYDAYARGDGLADTIAELDAVLERERFETLGRIGRLDATKATVVGFARDRSPFDVFGIVGPLAVLLHEEARRLGGALTEDEETASATRRRGVVTDRCWTREGAAVALGGRDAPFGSVGAALAFALEERPFGQGSAALRDGAGDARLDEATVERVRDQAIETVHAQMFGRALPPQTDGTPGVGYLPVNYISAKQSRNGNLGGARGESGVDLRLEVLAAVRRSDIGRVDLTLLVLSDVGEARVHQALGAKKRCWCGAPHAAPKEGTATHARHVEFIRLRPGQLATLIAPHVAQPLSAKRIGQIVAHAREEVGKKLVDRALLAALPPKRARAEAAPLPWEGTIA